MVTIKGSLLRKYNKNTFRYLTYLLVFIVQLLNLQYFVIIYIISKRLQEY
jgi:hypothetical protein